MMPTLPRRPHRLLLSLVPLVLLVAALPLTAVETHPFGLDDYSALRSARAVAVSPDGRTVLFVAQFLGDKGPVKREWHLVDTPGGIDRTLNLPEAFQPSGFTRDGAALFGVYAVEKKPQLGIVPLDARRPTHIVSLPGGAGVPSLSPDGHLPGLAALPGFGRAAAERLHGNPRLAGDAQPMRAVPPPRRQPPHDGGPGTRPCRRS